MWRMMIALQYIGISMIFLVPLYILYWKFLFDSIVKSCLHLVFAFYLVAVYALVGLPNLLYMPFDFGHNFIPFLGIQKSIGEAFLNVLLFVPLGIFLPLLCNRYQKFEHALLFGLGTTIGIEVLQIFTYRATDINDVITNVTGTVVGYLAVRIVTKGFTRWTLDDRKVRDVYLTMATAFFVMFVPCAFISKAMGNF